MITLRPYQSRGLDAIRDEFRAGRRSALYVLPTGGGKTVCFSELARRVLANGKRVVTLVHRDELVEQVSETLTSFGVQHGVLAAGRREYGQAATVASVFTLARALDRLPAPDLLIIDEAHHVTVKSTWGKVVAAWPNTLLLGVTATPQRLSGEGLGAVFETMVQGPTVGTLISDGYLADYRLFAPSRPDTAHLHKRGGDYQQGETAALMNKSTITGNAVAHYRKHADGRPAVAFCVSIRHAEDVAAEFRAAGYRAVSIDGGTDLQLRRMTVRDFREGRINVLVSCDLISEGFDCPGIHCGILLRPTASLGLYLQQVGRCLRTSPGKDRAILLDHAGNSQRHGLPDDERQWSLGGRGESKAASEPTLSVRTCPQCFAVARAFASHCKECGCVFPVQARVVAQVEGELQAVDVAEVRRKREEETRAARTFNELVELARQRRYRDPNAWANIMMRARQRGNQKKITLLNR